MACTLRALDLALGCIEGFAVIGHRIHELGFTWMAFDMCNVLLTVGRTES